MTPVPRVTTVQLLLFDVGCIRYHPHPHPQPPQPQPHVGGAGGVGGAITPTDHDICPIHPALS